MTFETGGLTEKLGPLPVWVWAAAGIGGFLLFEKLRGRSTAATSAATSTVGVDPSLSGDSTVGDQFGAPPQAGQPGVSGITTNSQWATEAATALIDSTSYGWSPSEIETALWGYLNGQALTGAGTTIVNAALAQFGSPPQGTMAVASLTNPQTINPQLTAGYPTFSTDQEWAAYALQTTTEEMAQNPKPYGPSDVSTAISAYLNGGTLNSMQQRIVNHVIQLSGSPPTPPGTYGVPT